MSSKSKETSQTPASRKSGRSPKVKSSFELLPTFSRPDKKKRKSASKAPPHASADANQSAEDNSSKNAAAAAVAVAEKSGSGDKEAPKSPPTPQPSVSSGGKRQSIGSNGKTYAQLVQEAIVALKDRTGSSIPAIKKWLLAEYDHLEDSKHFKHCINQAIKTGTAQGRFEKVRCSYKVTASWKEKERNKKRKSLQMAKAKANGAKKSDGGDKGPNEEVKRVPKTYKELVKYNKEKLRDLEKTVSSEEYQKVRSQMQKKEQQLFKKEEAERKEKERLDRIRKRRFPMEDTKLHEEDKELGVKPPADVMPRPTVPYFWQMVLPLNDPGRQGRTSDHVLRYSKSDALAHGSHGLVSDLLQVYHFFRGDVHFTGDTESAEQILPTTKRKRGQGGKSVEEPGSSLIVPEFSLSNLIYSTEELLNGNGRKSRLVPPLISHLFVTCLQLLCRAPEDGKMGSSSLGKDPQKLLQFELNKYLLPALTPGSWPDVCHLYMDAVERFYSTESSRDPAVLPPLNTDLSYLFGRIDEPIIPMTPAPTKTNDNVEARGRDPFPLPEAYGAYLGDFRSVLYRAHEKLGRMEAWSLTAEELFALLRALTDDLLAFYPGMAEKIALREDKMYELLKAKKAADAKFRKVKLAYEGPAKPKKPQETLGSGDKDTNEASKSNGTNGATEVSGAPKPTATKKEYETALRMQQKASDAYEKGIRQLVARTEPVGHDRNHNALYCFRRDPEVLYVEELRNPSNTTELAVPEEFQFHRRSWHVIETSSLFDSFTSSLDIRGKREQDLYETMLGPAGGQQSLRRYLHDDVKDEAEKSSRRREKEALYKRLEVAKVKCDEKDRRSGRLAHQAEDELSRIQSELDKFEKQPTPSVSVSSTDDMTGLTVLRSFDTGIDRRETRRSREKHASSRPISHLPCSNLVPSGNIDGSGIVGILVSQLLSVEEACEDVAPWPEDKRNAWTTKVETSVHSWYTALNNVDQVDNGSKADISDSPYSVMSSGKKRRGGETPNSQAAGLQSITSVTNSLKQPLLELEERVADISNVAVMSRDAEIADENMSTDGSGDAQNRELDVAWKRELHRLRSTSSRQHLKVRQLLVKAISLARKAHASDVVAELRAALLLLHPNAASESRRAGISVLEAHGGFEGPEMEEADEEDDSGEGKGEETVSVLCAEAALLTGCLGGSEEATRSDWIELVKSCKTLSRLSSLTAGFAHVAEGKLAKITEEKDALMDAISTWEKEATRNRAGKKRSRTQEDETGPSEVWADVTFTDEICMVKAEEWPWWPAKKCKTKDVDLGKTIASLGRVLVAFMGEMGGLRIVKKDMIRPFTGEPIAEETDVPKKTRVLLDECLAMARRIQRGSSSGTRKSIRVKS